MEVPSEVMLEGSVEGSSEGDMVVSDDGIMEGKKRRRKGGKELTERCLSLMGKVGGDLASQRRPDAWKLNR